jgi:hypothetical protein
VNVNQRGVDAKRTISIGTFMKELRQVVEAKQ